MHVKVASPTVQSLQQQNKNAARQNHSPEETQSIFDDFRPEFAQLKTTQASMAANPRNQNLLTMQAMMANSSRVQNTLTRQVNYAQTLRFTPVGNKNLIQRVPDPHRLPNIPDAAEFARVNWVIVGNFTWHNIDMVANNNMGGTPMRAIHNDHGNHSIEYDPNIVNNLGVNQRYFIFLHEMTHIDAPEQRNLFISVKDKEKQADDSAVYNILIQHNPRDSDAVIESIYNYFLTLGGAESDTHPSDSVRARRISNIGERMRYVRCAVSVQNNNAISAEAVSQMLQGMHYQPNVIQQMLHQANHQGFMTFFNPNNNNVLSYYEAKAILDLIANSNLPLVGRWVIEHGDVQNIFAQTTWDDAENNHMDEST